MREPEIKVLEVERDRRRVVLHLEGGELANGWSPRPGKAAWCNVTVVVDATKTGGVVTSFGGEVWPSAWPNLFDVRPRTIYGQEVWLTERGLEVALAALDGVSGAGAVFV